MKKRKNFIIQRPVIVYCCILLCLGLLPIRILFINFSYDKAGNVENSKTIQLSESRGLIYDRNMQPLVCDSQSTVSVVKPTLKAINALKSILDSNKLDVVREEISKSNPVLLNIGNVIDCEDIITVPIYNRYNSFSVASHVIGYLDDSGKNGVCGVEKSFNSFFNENAGELKARFFVNANGDYLQGADLEIVDNGYMSKAGVVLTLDKNMQSAVEKAMDSCNIEKGAAVMIEVNTGEITAMVSRPDFDREKLEDALNDENLPLFNRALGAYPVGSVFKPLIAAVALENGINPADEYVCNGFVEIGSNVFNCTSSHGKVNMPSAVALSCNCYFVNLIQKIGVDKAIDIASTLGFGNQLTLADGISTYRGNLPNADELDSLAAKALFSFGQGNLSANLIQIASLYSALAAGGNYYTPYLLKGIVDSNGELLNENKIQAPFKVFTESTAQMISTFLELAVREGTGKKAAVENVRVCGKTATAQSGNFVDGKEKLITWFAGYYPYEKPEYVLVVMCEDGNSGAEDCAPVFSKAIDKILYNN